MVENTTPVFLAQTFLCPDLVSPAQIIETIPQYHFHKHSKCILGFFRAQYCDTKDCPHLILSTNLKFISFIYKYHFDNAYIYIYIYISFHLAGCTFTIPFAGINYEPNLDFDPKAYFLWFKDSHAYLLFIVSPKSA